MLIFGIRVLVLLGFKPQGLLWSLKLVARSSLPPLLPPKQLIQPNKLVNDN